MERVFKPVQLAPTGVERAESVRSTMIDNIIFKDVKNDVDNYDDYNVNNFRFKEPEFVERGEFIKRKDVVEIKDRHFFQALEKDLFMGLYKSQPEINNEEDIPLYLQQEREIIKSTILDKEFIDTRNKTVADDFNSYTYMTGFRETILRSIDEELDENEDFEKYLDLVDEIKKHMEDLDKLNKEQEQQDEDEELNTFDGNDNPSKKSDASKGDTEEGDIQGDSEFKSDEGAEGDFNTNSTDVGAKAGKSSKEGLERKINKLNQELEMLSTSVSSNLNNIRRNIVKSIKETNDKNDKVGDTLEEIGGGGHYSDSIKVSYENKIDFYKQFTSNDQLLKIAKQVGRMKEAINQASKKVSPKGCAIVDVEMGNNLKKITTTERMKLSNHSTKLDFYNRYVQKGLMQYYSEETELDRGPMVIAVDISGSMSGIRLEWAKAVAYCLLNVAIEQKRDCRIICFDTQVKLLKDYESKKKIKFDEVLDFLTVSAGGGTSFNVALNSAMKSINDSRYKHADIVFITDGSDSVSKTTSEKFIKTKEQKKFKMQTIFLASGGDQLRRISDNVLDLTPGINESYEKMAEVINGIEEVTEE